MSSSAVLWFFLSHALKAARVGKNVGFNDFDMSASAQPSRHRDLQLRAVERRPIVVEGGPAKQRATSFLTVPPNTCLPFTVTTTGWPKSIASGDNSIVNDATSRTIALNVLPLRRMSTRPDRFVCWKNPRSVSSVARDASVRISSMMSQRLRLNRSTRSVSHDSAGGCAGRG